MAQFTFEGDYKILANPQIKLVESVLQKRGFKDGKVIVGPVGKEGDNYMAHVKRFIYEAKDGATLKTIGKIAPASEELRAGMNTMPVFKNEILMYNVILPKLNNLQISAGVSEDEKVRFPICYGVVTEAPFEFILLEDLNESGFQILDRSQPLSNEYVRLVLKDLARYHSLSYVLRHSEPETYKNVVGKLFNIWITLDVAPNLKQFLELTENDLLLVMHDLGEKYKNVLNGSVTQTAAIARKMEIYERSTKFSVIQHGDFWYNNILFRFEDGKPVQDVMIDYQLSKESNPAADILYFILTCTDHASRMKHYQEWIDYYHKILDDSLTKYDLKADHIYPRDELDAGLKIYGRIMVNASFSLTSILVREAKDAVDFGDLEDKMAQNSLTTLDAATITKFRERIQGIVDSALEFGLISL